jgi:NADH:ubiquinone oxidoreductase subunit 5 (subunit L)/multisubunit Na+/H+ antiporter MnhA subunit
MLEMVASSPRVARRLGQLGALAAGLGALAASTAAVLVARGEDVSAAFGPAEFRVDQLAAVLLLLVFGVSAIVQSYAVRYLAGDPRAARFVAGAGLLTAASAGLVTAGTLITLAVCWSLAGAALCLLLGMYWHLPAARDGVRRTALAFLAGDLALWTVVAVATAARGRIDLRDIGSEFFNGPIAPVLACLVVVAALSRSAQIPFHRWLPATLAAPTPVSALLHAGVVNAGGILLIRMAPLATDDVARVLTLAAGAATMVYGALIMLVKPDIKGALAHSTMAQMGFMILTCGLGLWAVAVIHLVGHGFYKATLFLSSGSAIARHRRFDSLPPAAPLTRRQVQVNAAAAGLVPAVALAAALSVTALTTGEGLGAHAAEHALLIFAWVTGAAVTWGWLRRCPGLRGILIGGTFLIPSAAAYVAIIYGITGYLNPALPPPGLSVMSVWIVAVAVLSTLGCLAALRYVPGAARLQRAVYTAALSAGHVSPAQSMGARS